MKHNKCLRSLSSLMSVLALASVCAKADTPRMIGVNLAGAEFTHTVMPGTINVQYWYPRASDVDYAKAVGAELIRVPFRWERVLRETNGVFASALSTTDIAALDASLDDMEAHGMRAILDMHNYGAARLTINGVSNAYAIGSTQVPVSEYARVWRLIADHYKDRDSIWGYDIMNEPGNGLTMTNWVSYAQAAVDAIREVDTKHAIILEGLNSAHSDSWPTTGAPLLAVTDPADNLVFSAHCYPDYDQWGDFNNGTTVSGELVRADRYPDLASALDVGVDRVKPFVDWCVQNNVRGLLGEYAIPHSTDTANWNVVLDRMLAYLRDNGNGLISATQWGIGLADHPGVQPRKDNSIASGVATVWPGHVDGVGTNYWSPFTWYDESIAVSADYSFAYSYASTSPAATASLVTNSQPGYTGAGGTNATRFTYAIPSGGYAGGGIHIRGPLSAGAAGGVDISRNIAAGHVLSFYAKGTVGATPSVTLGSTSNTSGLESGGDTATGNWISLNGLAPLSGTWRRYEIPLGSIMNTALAAKNRVQRLRITGGPANGSTYDVYLDRIRIEPSVANTAPSVSVDTSTGGGSFNAGQSVTLVATASDADPGDSIDYVEFYANHGKIGIDDTAPYQIATTFSAGGSYDITAIAFDSHGFVTQSAAKTLTISAGTLASFESVAADDGYVVESTETSNVGGAISSTTTIQAGDNASNCQIKGILSFDTSPIPDGAVIISATLRLKRSSLIGTNPFTTHGACNVSVKNGGYSGNAQLLASDFQSVDSAANAGVLSNPAADGDWAVASLDAAGLAAINKTNKTQLRVAFATDDDNDATADTMVFHSGNDATAANRPVLEIIYQ